MKTFSIFVTIFLISILLIHSKTGFITRNFGEKIPSWDNTRELLDWDLIAITLTEALQQKELDSVATLNWYDSGQLTVALNYRQIVGVIGPNSNHFKYMDLNDKNFMTLVDVRLIHKNEDFEIKQVLRDYDYNVIKKIKLPLLRGNEKYGIVSVFSIDKISKKR